MRGGRQFSFSIFSTRLLETPASPISRSLANGGHVDIRSVGRTDGFALNSSTPTSVRFRVAANVS